MTKQRNLPDPGEEVTLPQIADLSGKICHDHSICADKLAWEKPHGYCERWKGQQEKRVSKIMLALWN